MRPRSRRSAPRSPYAAPPASHRLASRQARRPRRFGSLDERVRRRGRRIASLVLAAAWLAGLVALLASPAFHVRHVDVSGNRRLTAGQVVAAAGLEHPGSVFQVDAGTLEHRLASATWVRAAWVSPRLPDRVSIRVDEWQPVAVYRAGGGQAWYLSDQAVALGPAEDAGAGALLGVDGPVQPAPRTGRAPLDRALLTALVNIQRRLPDLIGQDVQSFTIDGCGDLTLNARKGWKAQFGRVLTPEERAALTDKVAALRSLAVSGSVDFDSAALGYVNVMNPSVVAVPDRSRTARPVRTSPSPVPTVTVGPQPIMSCR
ncbi:MAG TPA: FtsQ-type POTRA domain-containing protein [Candidatus Dormibacteraeota bacterium]